ncbi:PTS system, galactitol-specific IIA component [Pilibacter termitis]|uniref:PTS system, galactitol-specific IIA component n=1 Tax=Pilibacter termitis TaxID=263852 RepID=A0A1T4K734_9ENTE|nr:PTS sugar transporter subunit IIA [Pilibacter termitis]SJZ38234.1 PTS system, galactitol-specific IIA component [Pilibacter termitis]
MIPRDFIFHQVNVQNRNEFFEHFSNLLEKKGFVKTGFASALKIREYDYPTGLPVPHGVAIPHTDGNFVQKDAIIVATFEHPILFHEMGGDEEDTVEVRVAFLLAVRDGKKHLEVLQKLILAVQNTAFIEEMLAADNQIELANIVEKEIGHYDETVSAKMEESK